VDEFGNIPNVWLVRLFTKESNMNATRVVIVLLLAAGMLTGVAACKSKSATAQNDQSSGSAVSESTKTTEHPQSDHPKADHPKSEHPADHPR
jgi:hypothetical protein